MAGPMSTHQTEQQKTNARARKIGARVNVAKGWDVTAADGTLYRVTTKAELDALLTELEKMAGEQ